MTALVTLLVLAHFHLIGFVLVIALGVFLASLVFMLLCTIPIILQRIERLLATNWAPIGLLACFVAFFAVKLFH